MAYKNIPATGRRANPRDPMRFITKQPSGNYTVRIYITELGYQVSFGTYKSLEEAQHNRDINEYRYRRLLPAKQG